MIILHYFPYFNDYFHKKVRNMKVCGVIAELNPLHNGHAHFLKQLKAPDGVGATHVVAVMSGNYVQRGEPALLPKFERAKTALACGADVVVELPTPYALSSAEGFARAGVALLAALGCVDVLAFGSECGDIAALKKAAATLDSERCESLLRYHLEGGISFAEARQKALSEAAGAAIGDLLSSPNNTLGIEYLRAIAALGAPMTAATVKRVGADHDAAAPLGDIASASYLRGLIGDNRLVNALPFMPPDARDCLTAAGGNGLCPAKTEKAEAALLYRLRQMSLAEFAALPGVSEGLENRLFAAARQAGSVDEFLSLVKTRRYPLTRLKRLLMAAYLGLTADLAPETPPYIRVLGATEAGYDVLRAAKTGGCALPLLTRKGQADALDPAARALWEFECNATDLYGLFLPAPSPCGAEQTAGFVKM